MERMEQQQRSKVEQWGPIGGTGHCPSERERARKTGKDQHNLIPAKEPQITMATAATGSAPTKTATMRKVFKDLETSSPLRNEIKNNGEDEEDFVLTRHPIETDYVGVDDGDSQGKINSLLNRLNSC